MKRITTQNKLHFRARSAYQAKPRRKKTVRKDSHTAQSFVATQAECPEYFLLKANYCEEVLDFISHIKKIAYKGKSVNVNMRNIVEIGEGAISMLLSVLEELKEKRVEVFGSLPSNPGPRDVLERSGFLNYVHTAAQNRKSTKNMILTTGDASTHQRILKPQIRNAMKTVWGVSGRNPLVYGCVFEMMRNAVDHAYKTKSQTKWHWSVSHDDANSTVKFSFVDNGKGLITTFKQGLLKKMFHFFKDNIDVVETAYKDGITSRTGLTWRGKGLPTIFETFQDNYIKNLVVITNDVYLDFENGVRKKLKNSFVGTYYYWTVDQTCVRACFKD